MCCTAHLSKPAQFVSAVRSAYYDEVNEATVNGDDIYILAVRIIGVSLAEALASVAVRIVIALSRALLWRIIA